MLGEVRDTDTAKLATQAALTGHLVLSTLHTNDAPGAITRLYNLGIEPYLVGATVCGVVGRDGGYTARVADACVIVPTVNPRHVTPHSEAFQGVVWHLIVSHPAIQSAATKWETAAA